MAESTDVRAPAAGADAAPGEAAGEHVSEYTTETGDVTAGSPARPAARKPVVTGNALGTGRRKQAIARVRIQPGSGKFVVNDRTLEAYFPNKLHQQLINDPFKVLDLLGSYSVIAKITGGGPSGQAGALRLAIARSLNEIDRENNRAALKKSGFLTRDARVIERKKAGLKKARKASQFSKR